MLRGGVRAKQGGLSSWFVWFVYCTVPRYPMQSYHTTSTINPAFGVSPVSYILKVVKGGSKTLKTTLPYVNHGVHLLHNATVLDNHQASTSVIVILISLNYHFTPVAKAN
ncbi:MAG: hypothetical protein J3Q66DRAFT_387292 [Benniella sp.]|nr:MAG: hypothetical protein J3Q66DRAFT_387292 [Benniella sp.]